MAFKLKKPYRKKRKRMKTFVDSWHATCNNLIKIYLSLILTLYALPTFNLKSKENKQVKQNPQEVQLIASPFFFIYTEER